MSLSGRDWAFFVGAPEASVGKVHRAESKSFAGTHLENAFERGEKTMNSLSKTQGPCTGKNATTGSDILVLWLNPHRIHRSRRPGDDKTRIEILHGMNVKNKLAHVSIGA